ncbi:ArsR/SmtB family transcription factor [Haloarcula nitratireducens]|uniref:ArsR family transcriptional regulator n=1 Tax=Haloarcula nitratireducens TaxID=2487749 RepID=A0AAW4PCP9_9EURY|nr:helix-turn-helix transcriptional regulator [Halomicroarcula nitratireducens]MBX0295488.1 ArsR family transcriptional regulator [Halomicroarcula nitratireducens]
MAPSNDRPLETSLDAESLDSASIRPPPDDLFRAVANTKRRQLLALLATQETIALDDLTDVLVGMATTTDGPAGPDEWAQVKIELVHAHLPLLTEAGLVEYDEDSGEVRLRSLPDAVYELFEFADEYERAVENRQ